MSADDDDDGIKNNNREFLFQKFEAEDGLEGLKQKKKSIRNIRRKENNNKFVEIFIVYVSDLVEPAPGSR
jgi:hypothetical protein